LSAPSLRSAETPTGTPTPTPGGKEKPCTPGFWKNHTELWYGPDYCGLTSEETLCNLQPQRNKDQDAREAASACLNAAQG